MEQKISNVVVRVKVSCIFISEAQYSLFPPVTVIWVVLFLFTVSWRQVRISDLRCSFVI